MLQKGLPSGPAVKMEATATPERVVSDSLARASACSSRPIGGSGDSCDLVSWFSVEVVLPSLVQ